MRSEFYPHLFRPRSGITDNKSACEAADIMNFRVQDFLYGPEFHALWGVLCFEPIVFLIRQRADLKWRKQR
jgi:hypothetical protein